MDIGVLRGKIEECYDLDIPQKVLEPYEVFNKEGEYLEYDKCEGKIAKEAIIPYPPGIPMICAGEKITRKSINIIKDYIENNKDILGIKCGKVNVIKEIF